MPAHEKINYVEFPARDPAGSKQFFSEAFGWTFTDYGPDYCSFSDQGLDGGFFRSDRVSTSDGGSALIVFHSAELEATLEKVKAAGGAIVQPIFDFPGGRRFHFADPSGNEFAVWSEAPAEHG